MKTLSALKLRIMVQAFKDYDREVKEGVFPSEEHEYKVADDVIEKLY